MNSDKISRREFMARTAKAGISIAAVAAAAKLLYESDVRNMLPKPSTLTGLRDYSVAPLSGQTMSIVSGLNRSQTVGKAIELLGGITRFVRPGETVLLKPNVGFSRPPRVCATSHPDIISEITSLCYEQAKAKKVYITDNPINDAKSCFELSEILAASAKCGAEVILPKADFFRPLTLPGGKLINNWPVLYEPFKNVDKVIGIAVVKDHSRSGASMIMKNWYGLLGGGRNIFHTDINNIIVELATLVKPTLVILDGTQVMISNGPTGGSSSDLKQSNIMIAGCDQVAVDSFGATLLNMKPADLPYLLKAQELKLGTTDYESLKPIYAKLES
ncbi:MAG: DUF362 domain-containing protein [Sedimentisphaerales bacterium]